MTNGKKCEGVERRVAREKAVPGVETEGRRRDGKKGLGTERQGSYLTVVTVLRLEGGRMKAGRSEWDRTWKGRMRDGKTLLERLRGEQWQGKEGKKERRDVGRRVQEKERMREEDQGMEYLEIERWQKNVKKTRGGERCGKEENGGGASES